jgi:hypothetical protein
MMLIIIAQNASICTTSQIIFVNRSIHYVKRMIIATDAVFHASVFLNLVMEAASFDLHIFIHIINSIEITK